jgi:hypothetical protein
VAGTAVYVGGEPGDLTVAVIDGVFEDFILSIAEGDAMCHGDLLGCVLMTIT